MKKYVRVLVVVLGMVLIFGCQHAETKKKIKKANFGFLEIEADWIRAGEPLDFEGELWYPTDDIEILLDKEVFLLGEYKGIEFFIERTDVRPYNRLFTKFGNNKFRVYSKIRVND